jgi:signal transduction histidine kinase
MTAESVQTAPRILIADDEPYNVIIISRILENAGYAVVGVESGEQAVQQAADNNIFVFILDINMHGLSGYETAAMLRQMEKTKHTPIIFISGQYTEQMHVEKGYETGAVDYIIKPINEKILLGKVNIFFDLYNINNQLLNEIQIRKNTAARLQQSKELLDEKVREQTLELRQRFKEIDCLYGISKINEKKDTNIEDVLLEIADLIPRGFRYSEITCANVSLWGCNHFSGNFAETKWRLSTELLVMGEVCGSITVYCKEDMPASFQGPFSKEEVALLAAIGESVCHIIEKRTYELQLRRLSQTTIKLLEEERRRVARDLHDSIGQLLATLRLEVAWMLKNPEAQNFKEDLNNFIRMTTCGNDDLKRICMGLRPASLDKAGLTAAIEELLGAYAESKRFAIKSDIDKINHYEVATEAAINIYRIIQESMNNIQKHAAASEVTVTVQQRPRDVDVTIKDNGKGFDIASLSANSLKLGLLGMKERTDLCKGMFEIASAPGKGTTVHFIIPNGVDT